MNTGVTSPAGVSTILHHHGGCPHNPEVWAIKLPKWNSRRCDERISMECGMMEPKGKSRPDDHWVLLWEWVGSLGTISTTYSNFPLEFSKFAGGSWPQWSHSSDPYGTVFSYRGDNRTRILVKSSFDPQTWQISFPSQIRVFCWMEMAIQPICLSNWVVQLVLLCKPSVTLIPALNHLFNWIIQLFILCPCSKIAVKQWRKCNMLSCAFPHAFGFGRRLWGENTELCASQLSLHLQMLSLAFQNRKKNVWSRRFSLVVELYATTPLIYR